MAAGSVSPFGVKPGLDSSSSTLRPPLHQRAQAIQSALRIGPFPADHGAIAERTQGLRQLLAHKIAVLRFGLRSRDADGAHAVYRRQLSRHLFGRFGIV